MDTVVFPTVSIAVTAQDTTTITTYTVVVNRAPCN